MSQFGQEDSKKEMLTNGKQLIKNTMYIHLYGPKFIFIITQYINWYHNFKIMMDFVQVYTRTFVESPIYMHCQNV